MGPPYKIDNWQAAVAEKRKALRDSIPKSHLLPADLSSKVEKGELLPSDEAVLTSGVLSSVDLEITDIDDAAVIVERVASRRYTAVQVAEAFCKRASIAHQTANCLTETMYEQALVRARWLDEYMEREGRPVGMLHGLPVSLKVCYFRIHRTVSPRSMSHSKFTSKLTHCRIASTSKASPQRPASPPGSLTSLPPIALSPSPS